jgi:hypothetical protein
MERAFALYIERAADSGVALVPGVFGRELDLEQGRNA